MAAVRVPAVEGRRRTTVLIAMASILEKCDEQILPALYSRVGASFQATPTDLGAITLARALMQALSSPLAGVASNFMPRGRVIAAGCLIWALFTALFACTSSLAAALPLCAMNGIGLALVIPSVQSLTADMHASEARGQAFGQLWLIISCGGMLGALYATNMGALSPFGLDGWRVAFVSVSLLSATTGILNALYVVDPTYRSHHPPQPAGRARPGSPLAGASSSSNAGSSSSLAAAAAAPSAGEHHAPKLDAAMARSVLADIGVVLRIPTFCIIIFQGIIGSVPYASLVFLTLYFQLLGMSDAAASALVALYLAGGGLGGLLGGWVGDLAARRWPNHGRIAATQLSVASGVPFAFLIFKGLPHDGAAATVALYSAAILAFALATSWPGPCCNNPVFAEIVPSRMRNLVFAFDRCFEGAVAAFATPLVGLLAQRLFGFSGASTVSGDAGVDLPNARALGSALLAFLAVPWTLCFFIYSGLHVTYPADRRAALALARLKGADDEEDGVPLTAGEFGGGNSGGGNGGGGGGRGASVSQRQGVATPEERGQLLGAANA